MYSLFRCSLANDCGLVLTAVVLRGVNCSQVETLTHENVQIFAQLQLLFVFCFLLQSGQTIRRSCQHSDSFTVQVYRRFSALNLIFSVAELATCFRPLILGTQMLYVRICCSVAYGYTSCVLFSSETVVCMHTRCLATQTTVSTHVRTRRTFLSQTKTPKVRVRLTCGYEVVLKQPDTRKPRQNGGCILYTDATCTRVNTRFLPTCRNSTWVRIKSERLTKTTNEFQFVNV